MVFTHLSTEQGLSQATVNDVLQDSQGFIWLATQNGLNRYDGVELKRYYRDPEGSDGLASDYVVALDEDRFGNIWIATDGGGVAVWNRRTDTIRSYRHRNGDARSLASDQVHDVLVDRSGHVWIATRDRGLDRLDPRSGAITHFVHDATRPESLGSNRNLYALLEDRDGAIWVSSSVGLDRHVGPGNRFRHFSPAALAAGEHAILSLTQDSRGDIWLGSFDAGLQRLEPATGRFTSYRHDPGNAASLSDNDVRAVVEDSAQRLWIGTQGGLDLLDRSTGTFQHYRHDRANPRSLADDFVQSLFQDRNGLLWVGTNNSGVSRWNPRSWSLGHRLPEWLAADASMINAFADAPDGGLWVGTMRLGLVRLAAGSGRRIAAPTPEDIGDTRVMSLLTDRAGRLWIGTMRCGLSRLGVDGRLQRFRAGAADAEGLGSDGIMSLLEDRAGRVWIGTFEGGVSVHEPQTGTIRRIRDTSGRAPWLERARATVLQEDGKGRIWVGTDGDGLLLLDARRGLLRQFVHAPGSRGSLASNSIYSLHLDGLDSLWIGTSGAGLDRLADASGELARARFENRSQAGGLTNDVIYGIERDRAGMLWLASNNGLMRFDPRAGQITTFHASHGAQGEEFTSGASFRTAGGRLLFAGTDGYNDFDPLQLQESDAPPPLALTRVEVQNRPLRSDTAAHMLTRLELGHRDNVLTLEFAALDFTDPQRNQYAYKLEGFDKSWVKLGNKRRVSYTNLRAGEYVFWVRAASAHSVWNDEGLSLPIIVRPAPWATWWAYSAYAALVILLLVAAYRHQARRLRAEQDYAQRLASEVSSRTEELRQRNAELAEASAAKSSFLARMSHEIRTPMNGVMGMTELLTTTALDARQRRYTEVISQSASALLKIINDILDLSKIEAGKVELEALPFDLEEVADDCVALLAPQASSKGVELLVAADPTLPRQFIGDALRIRQILMNFLGNALKFTAEGEVVMRIGARPGTSGHAVVHIAVSATGIGMDEASVARMFDAFSQADESTTRRFGGTGLGLSISKQLIELMGGQVGVTSQLGEGSTFWCELPLRVGDAAPLSPICGALSGLRAVVAIPLPSLQAVIARRLQAEGMTTLCVDSDDALERLLVRDPGPDVLVIDSDRLRIAKPNPAAMRSTRAGTQVVRVLLSRRAGDQALIAGTAGAKDVRLPRPVPAKVLCTAIADALPGNMPTEAMNVEAQVRDDSSAGNYSRGRVLVADDNAVNQLLAEAMLAMLGYATTLVADGGAALEQLSAAQYDAVLMDCEMPILDGLDATRRLRASEQGARRTPVIGLTAHASAEARAACLAAGMDDFLGKPYTLDELAAVLARWTTSAQPAGNPAMRLASHEGSSR